MGQFHTAKTSGVSHGGTEHTSHSPHHKRAPITQLDTNPSSHVMFYETVTDLNNRNQIQVPKKTSVWEELQVFVIKIFLRPPS